MPQPTTTTRHPANASQGFEDNDIIKLNADCYKHICKFLSFSDKVDPLRFVDYIGISQDESYEILRSYFQDNWNFFLEVIESNLPSDIVDSNLATFAKYNSPTLFSELIRASHPSISSLEKRIFTFHNFMDQYEIERHLQLMIVEDTSPYGFSHLHYAQDSNYHIRAIDNLCVYGYSKQELIKHCVAIYINGDPGMNIYFTSTQSRGQYIDIVFVNPIPSIENEINTISNVWMDSITSVSVFLSCPFFRLGYDDCLQPLFHHILGDCSHEKIERVVRHPTFDPMLLYYNGIDHETITMNLALSDDPQITARLELLLQLGIQFSPRIIHDASRVLRKCIVFLIQLVIDEDERWGACEIIARVSAMTSIGANPFIMAHKIRKRDGSVNLIRYNETAYDKLTNALDDEIIPTHLVPAFIRIREYHFLRAWPLRWQRGITSFMN